MVKLHTSFGVITLELDEARAPSPFKNFSATSRAGTTRTPSSTASSTASWYRAGGFEPGMKIKATKAPVKNEAQNGLKNTRYTVAMARTSEPHSATAQFFINVNDNGFLDHTAPNPQGWGYCVFGASPRARTSWIASRR